MKFLIQVVEKASVTVENNIIGKIDKGYLVLMGLNNDDNEEIANKMIKKLINLRIIMDENGKTNLSLNDVSGDILAVSQFTLYADCTKGNRPSFFKSGSYEHAKALYEYIVKKIREEYNITVETGEFGADMKVSLINDGPFTIMLDSDEIL